MAQRHNIYQALYLSKITLFLVFSEKNIDYHQIYPLFKATYHQVFSRLVHYYTVSRGHSG